VLGRCVDLYHFATSVLVSSFVALFNLLRSTNTLEWYYSISGRLWMAWLALALDTSLKFLLPN
jgi:hypothetical protein